MAAAAFSPDGSYLVTGADDAKVGRAGSCQSSNTLGIQSMFHIMPLSPGLSAPLLLAPLFPSNPYPTPPVHTPRPPTPSLPPSPPGQVKVWTLANGFCFVTFAEHTAPVTGVAFLPSGHAGEREGGAALCAVRAAAVGVAQAPCAAPHC